jgi:hypothetical protein
VAGEFVGAEQIAAAMQADDPSGLLAAWPQILAGALGYLTLLGFAFAFTQVFLTMPILRAKVEGMTVSDPVALTSTRQRPHDAAAEAGGFADALGVDVGAGL